jgi:Trypsin-like peptidase domain
MNAKSIFSLMTLFCALSGVGRADDRVLSTEEIVARSEPSIALVRGKQLGGTGFLVRPGILVTNAHVINLERIADVSVSFPSAALKDRGPLPVTLLWEDKTRDLAFLKVNSNLPPLTVDGAYRFRRGQDITVIGNPGTDVVFGERTTLVNAVSRGVMSSTISRLGQEYFQISISINHGNSGGPVFGSDGKIIGVATLKDPSHEGMAFCIPADVLAAATAELTALPASAAGKAGLVHDNRILLDLIAKLSKAYESLLDGYASSVDDALLKGFSPDDVLTEYRRTLYGEIVKAHKLVSDVIYPQLCTAVADPELPQEYRKNLNTLWVNLLALMTKAEHPKGPAAALRKKTKEIHDTHHGLDDGLRASLGVLSKE